MQFASQDFAAPVGAYVQCYRMLIFAPTTWEESSPTPNSAAVAIGC